MGFNAWVFEDRIKPLEFKEVIKPNYVNDDYVLLDIKAAALNRRDFWITQGLYPDIPENIPAVLGSDCCGTYDGKEYIACPNINWGDGYFPAKEYGILGLHEYGTLAEKIYIRKSKLYPKPTHLSIEEAACLPLGALTAYRALFSRSKLKKGQNVLISGVGGGVALLACQFAVAIGAKVYVTSSSEEKIESAKEIGAIDGVSYKDIDAMNDLSKKVGGFEVVIDSAGGKGFNQLLKMCRLGANVSIYGGTTGSLKGIAVPNLFFKQISIHGSTMGSDKEFGQMVNFVNEHKIVPIIHEVRSMSQGKETIEDLGRNMHFGKYVLKNS